MRMLITLKIETMSQDSSTETNVNFPYPVKATIVHNTTVSHLKQLLKLLDKLVSNEASCTTDIISGPLFNISSLAWLKPTILVYNFLQLCQIAK